MNDIKRFIIKRLMKLVENELSSDDYPILKLVSGGTATHFSQQEREAIMLESSERTYLDEIQHPWDLYFGLDIAHFLKGQVVLDLGCASGGRSIAWYERYKLNKIYGIDILNVYIKAAQNYAGKKRANAEFVCSKGESLPFKDEVFDAILTFDVLEHVQDIKQVLIECNRVLRKGGRLFVVFPSFLHPYEHHLSPVTLTPFIHYFFSGKDLIEVYNEIVDERGPERNWWYKRQRPRLEAWERSNLINGTTKAKFRRLISRTNWNIYYESNKPFMKTLSERYPALNVFRYMIAPFARLRGFDEILSERIVYILEKPR